MKLIEALKNLKTVEKRIEKNAQMIGQYAAWVSTETPPFETEDKQREEVKSLIQANLDLEREYLRLKIAIDYTNLNTKVTIGERTHCITELLILNGKATADSYGKRQKIPGAAKFRFSTYNALNAAPAAQRMQQIYTRGIDGTNPPKVICAFSEAEKNKALTEWDSFIQAIDAKLEVVNAETELAGY